MYDSTYFFTDSFEPHIIVLMSLDLAITGRFPETLIKTIFNVEFLARLDNQLESK